jgi:hypothetical protein
MMLYDKIKALYPALTDADFLDSIRLQDDGDGPYIAAWNHPTFARPTTEQLSEAPAYVAVPTSVTLRQAKLALLGAGLLSQVDAAIAAAGTAAQIEWTAASEVVRDSPLVASLSAALGLTSTELDSLFTTAGSL